jgi:ABC-2 type transport system permease protein/lipopolysaccharide transport system permease protein
LINKVFCPREVFPISSVILAGIDTALATLALIVLFATNGVTPGVMAVWTPVLVLVVVATTTGWALLVSVWTVYVRDVRQALPLMLQLGLFATPVAYGFEKIPAGVRPAYSVLNPLAPVIDGLRRTLLQNRAPDLELLGLAAVGAGFVLSAGYYLFKRLEVNVVDVA